MSTSNVLTREEERLNEDRGRVRYWKRWGPYLSERQWATVREDYSANGDAWSYFTHEDAMSRAFRWGEDGIAGVSDTHAYQCFSFAFWNEKDDFLKERLFGLTGHEGNHGEDVKEEYFYLDNTPCHTYMSYLYKYPQKKFPYEELRRVNGQRSRLEPEYELVDTGIFQENRYFDIYIDTAKENEDAETLYFKIMAYNRGPEPASLHVLPQAFFRNVWSWGEDDNPIPEIRKIADDLVETNHWKLGKRYIQFSRQGGVDPELLFCDNVTNNIKLWGPDQENESLYPKDAFHEYVCNNVEDAVNPEYSGTKMAAWYVFKDIASGESCAVTVKFTPHKPEGPLDVEAVDDIFEDRVQDADEFYYKVSPMNLDYELRSIQRQAFAGMLWNKQYYQYIYAQWAKGDPKAKVAPPPERIHVRNQEWKHLHIDDILSMPDKWEYPFFAAWDTAFHCIPLAMIDPDFAKKQLERMVEDWYLHPNGQIPAYEWNFSDCNPPVHAWATFRVFKIERRIREEEDIDFLERVFQKLLLNFTWWVNRKDANGNNVFEGGFLGLDNIGLFNRSEPLPTGGLLEQADGSGWMGFFCLQMLNIALELSKHRPIYENICSKFFEHFIFIADAMSYKTNASAEQPLWNDVDGFYYDCISWGPHNSLQLPVRSLVGLIPLFASITLDAEVLVRYPRFARRVEWFIKHRPEMARRNMASLSDRGEKGRILLSLVNRERLERILDKMLSEDEFLSPYGIRSLSKFHKDYPYTMNVNDDQFSVEYCPAESTSAMFGGNSNWRGPIWFPTNFLLVESLQRFFLFYGNKFLIKCPSKTGYEMNLAKVAENLQHRLITLFTRNSYKENRRPYNGGMNLFDFDQHYDDHYYFHEYYDCDTGRGLGSKHQNGWTGLVAKLIHDTGLSLSSNKTFGDRPQQAAEQFFDDDIYHHYEPRRSTSRYHLRRTSSTHRIVRNIGELLEKYNASDDWEDDLESSQSRKSTLRKSQEPAKFEFHSDFEKQADEDTEETLRNLDIKDDHDTLKKNNNS